MIRDLSHITAAILVGGQGTRLRCMIGEKPKALAEIGGRPFLSYLLDQLEIAGIQNIVLCIGYRGEEIKKAFGNTYGSLNLIYSHETEPLGTAGALRLALPLFETDDLLVMNGDSYCSVDLNDFLLNHQKREAKVTIVLTKVIDPGRYGQVIVDDQGRIEQFIEKGKQNKPGWINAGIYLLRRNLLLTIPDNRPVSLEQEIFKIWIDQPIYAYFTYGTFVDIGTPEGYVSAIDSLYLKDDKRLSFCS